MLAALNDLERVQQGFRIGDRRQARASFTNNGKAPFETRQIWQRLRKNWRQRSLIQLLMTQVDDALVHGKSRSGSYLQLPREGVFSDNNNLNLVQHQPLQSQSIHSHIQAKVLHNARERFLSDRFTAHPRSQVLTA